MYTVNWLSRTSRASLTSSSSTPCAAGRQISPSRISTSRSSASASTLFADRSRSSRGHSTASMSSTPAPVATPRDKRFRHGVDTIKFADSQSRHSSSKAHVPAHATSNDEPAQVDELLASRFATQSARHGSVPYSSHLKEFDALDISQSAGKTYRSRKRSAGASLSAPIPHSPYDATDYFAELEMLDQSEQAAQVSSAEPILYDIPADLQRLIDRPSPLAGQEPTDPVDSGAEQERQEANQDSAADDPSESQPQLPSFFTYTLYKSPNNKPPPLHYANTFADAERVARLFLDCPLVAMDTEWLPNTIRVAERTLKHEVSVIQLAAADRIAVFHLARFPGTTSAELVPPSLRQILEDAAIRKVGVNVYMDGNRLFNYLDIQSRNLFELSHMYNLLRDNSDSCGTGILSMKLTALATQVNQYLGLPLQKGGTRMSNWTRALKDEQLIYAANDVYASVRLYDKMNTIRRKLEPVPSLPPARDVNLTESRLRFAEQKERLAQRQKWKGASQKDSLSKKAASRKGSSTKTTLKHAESA